MNSNPQAMGDWAESLRSAGGLPHEGVAVRRRIEVPEKELPTLVRGNAVLISWSFNIWMSSLA